jgi:hypothetical protein
MPRHAKSKFIDRTIGAKEIPLFNRTRSGKSRRQITLSYERFYPQRFGIDLNVLLTVGPLLRVMRAERRDNRLKRGPFSFYEIVLMLSIVKYVLVMRESRVLSWRDLVKVAKESGLYEFMTARKMKSIFAYLVTEQYIAPSDLITGPRQGTIVFSLTMRARELFARMAAERRSFEIKIDRIVNKTKVGNEQHEDNSDEPENPLPKG